MHCPAHCTARSHRGVAARAGPRERAAALLAAVAASYNFVVVPAEEKLLRRKFGEDFDLYCAQVGRWCPWF